MDYRQFTVEEFVLDSDFRRWVLQPNVESNTFWQKWLKEHPHKIGVLQEARSILLMMARVNYGWDEQMEDALWSRIEEEMRLSGINSVSEKDARPTKVIPLNAAVLLGSAAEGRVGRRRNFRLLARIAASVLVVMAVGATTFFLSQKRAKKSAESIALLVQDVPLGSKSTFDLADGTRITLNAGSRVIYPQKFADHERLIEIEGEAFLEVAKDSLKPFRVKTGKIMTEALGTAFNVRNEKGRVSIALVEGKVRVGWMEKTRQGEPVVLTPGERAWVKDNQHLLKEQFDINEVTAWKDGILYFERVSEREFFDRIERWYGVTVVTKGAAPRKWNYSGRFDDKDLEFVLMSVGYTMDFSFKIRNKEVSIRYD